MPCDYSKYPPNWKTEIRPRILERDGHKCTGCGVPNYAIIYRDKSNRWHIAPEGHEADAMALDGFKFVRVVLTVAHLDHDEDNWEVKDSRLEAMCQKCHLGYDALEKARRRKVKTKDSLNKYQIHKYKKTLFPL